jgi:hypothetical protein
MRTWKRLIPAVLLAILFVGTSLHAEDAETNADKITKLQKDVAQLQKDVSDLRKDVLDNAAQRAATTEQLARIRELVERMAAQQGVIRQTGFDPRSVAPGGAVPTTGTITVQNVYSYPATVRINDRSFRVQPNQTLPISGVPTGTFQYSVDVDGFGTVEPPRTDNLPPAGYRISIFPRM